MSFSKWATEHSSETSSLWDLNKNGGVILRVSLFSIFRVLFRGGNGDPLQYSCLENPMDGGAWWAAVHGVAKSQTRLSDFTFTFHFHVLEKEMIYIHSLFTTALRASFITSIFEGILKVRKLRHRKVKKIA